MKKIWIKLGTLTTLTTMIVPIVSCGFSKKEIKDDNVSQEDQINNSLGLYQALLWQMSAEKRAAMLSQYSQAIDQFDKVIQKNQSFLDTEAVKVTKKDDQYQLTLNPVAKNKFVPIVSMDIDETILDNTMYFVYLALYNKSFLPTTWTKWVRAKQGPIFEGVINFVTHVFKKGGMVALVSNRNQGILGGTKSGDEVYATRQNLIKQNYPRAFLDSYLWWNKGVTTYEDKEQTHETIKKLENKEARFNYINANGLKSRKMSQMNIPQGWNDSLNTIDYFKKNQSLPTQIVMKVGDDINDFNDNFTKLAKNPQNNKVDHIVRHAYMDDKNINNLFGKAAPKISFFYQNDKLIKKYYDPNLDVCKSLLEKKMIDDIVLIDQKDNPINPYETYLFISGNSLYGGWLNTFNSHYGKNIQGIKNALEEYWKQNEGHNIFN